MTEGFQGLSILESAIAAIVRATTPGEIFRELLAGTTCGSPRAVVFLLREQRWKGWKATGYGPLVAQAAQSVSLSDREGWLARAAASDERWIAAAGDDDVPRFGQAAPESAIALPVRVGGKAVAAVLAERGFDEQPWHPEALAVLVQAVRLRLEFDLACRRLRAVGVSSTDAATASAAEPAPANNLEPAPASSVELAPASSVEPRPAEHTPAASTTSYSELDPWQEPALVVASHPEHDEARRFARLVATDIRLYNEDAVAHGRVEGDLALRLGDQLQKGRESFERRFPGLGPEGMSILRDSYVQVLAGGDASLIPPD